MIAKEEVDQEKRRQAAKDQEVAEKAKAVEVERARQVKQSRGGSITTTPSSTSVTDQYAQLPFHSGLGGARELW